MTIARSPGDFAHLRQDHRKRSARNHTKTIVLTACLAILWIATPAAADYETLSKLNEAFKNVVEATAPAVVSISTITFEPDPGHDFGAHDMPPLPLFDDPEPNTRSGVGSGTIIEILGKPYVITNQHVVAGVDKVIVQLHDRREFEARIVGWDPKVDVAVLELVGANGLTTIPVGNSDDVKPGELVLAVGSPFGLSQSVTIGIVSAISRHDQGIEEYEDFIQTDAAINRGNSGGPLLNLKGEVIALNTAIRTTHMGGNVGVGFSIPMNMAMPVMEQLVEHGYVLRGWLGASVQNINDDLAQIFSLAETTGVIVTRVVPGTPAQAAGIARGDIILEADDVKIDTVNRLRNQIAATMPGSVLRLNIIRGGRRQSLRVVLGESPYVAADYQPAPQPRRWEGLGISLQDLNTELARAIGSPGLAGAIITDVEPGSPASMARPVALARGDVVVEVGKEPVNDANELRNQLKNLKPGASVLLFIYRRGSAMFTVLNVPAEAAANDNMILDDRH